MTERVDLEFTDGGSLDGLNKQAKKLKNTLKEAASAAASTTTPISAKKTASAARQTADEAAKGTAGGKASEDSGLARGVTESTGAAARDFANQARGLGGLVHVYATFAANIFAISAAFSALNKVANITNMVKGLEQLGAASGKNLGQVSKDLVKVSDGALSLADSMQAVAQASSGGMSSANILRMGNVAKQASQALGRDMTDAVSRLTRGITKIEPELLDELGIMVKVDEATRNYANQIGKTASSLTNFEKRQAYANAVLEEGERKFSSIKLDANPYQKILASITNIAVAGGELINKVLSPILNFMSQSPTALTAGLALVITQLTKQALPALVSWNKGLKEAGKAASEKIIEKHNDVVKSAGEYDAFREEKALAAVQTRLEKINKLKLAPSTAKIVGNMEASIVDKDVIASLEKQAAIRGKLRLLKEDAGTRSINSAKNAQIEAEEIRNLTRELKELQAAREANVKLHSPDTLADKAAYKLSVYSANERLANRESQKLLQSRIVGIAAENLATKGYITTLKELYATLGNATRGRDVKGDLFTNGEVKIGKMRAAWAGFTSTIGLTISAISTIVSSFTGVLAIISAIAAAAAVVYSWLSKNAKEYEAFTTAADTLTASIDNVGKTLDNIRGKKLGDAFSTESTQARANAYNELTDALYAQAKAYDKLNEVNKNSWIDRLTDWTKGLFKASSKDKVAEGIADSIKNGLKLIEDGDTKKEAQKLLQDILGAKVDLNDRSSIIKAILKDAESIGLKSSEIAKAFETTNRNINNSASALTSFKDGLKETERLVNEINSKLKPQDDVGKLGNQLIIDSGNLAKALEKPISGMNALVDLSKSMATLSLLPPETAMSLVRAGESLTELKKDLQLVEQTLEKNAADLTNFSKIRTKGGVNSEVSNYSNSKGLGQLAMDNGVDKFSIPAQKKQLADEAVTLNKYRNDLLAQIDAQVNKQRAVVNDIFVAGNESLTRSLRLALIEGSMIAARGYLSVLKSAGGDTAEKEWKLKDQELAAQLAAIDATYASITALDSLNLTIEESNLLAKEVAAKNTLASTKSEMLISEAAKTLEKIAKDKTALELKKKVAANPEQYRDKTSVNSPEIQDAIKGVSGTYLASVERDKAKAKIQGEREANRVQGAANVSDERLVNIQKELDTASKILSVDLEDTKLKQSQSAFFDENLQIQKDSLEKQLLANKYTQDQIETYKAIAKAQLLIDRGQDVEKSKELIAKKQKEAFAREKQFNEDNKKQIAANIDETLKGIETTRVYKAEQYTKELKDRTELSNLRIADQEAEMSRLQSLGYLTNESIAAKRAELDIQKQNNTYLVEQNNLAESHNKIIADLERQKAQSNDKAGFEKKINDETAAYRRQLSLLDQKNASAIANANAQKQATDELNKQEEIVKNIVSLTESLALVFGKVGAGIGATLAAMQKMAEKDKKLAEQRKNLEKENIKLRNKANDDGDNRQVIQDLIDNEKQLKKNKEDYYISEMNNISAVAAASKQMFAEKTAAYKALDAVQTATAVSAMAKQAEQMAQYLKELPILVQGGVANLFKQGGWAGFAGAAAFLAMMASLGFNGGASASPPSGFTAADQQKVQGTGQSYKNGKLVENGGGAWGDSSKKSTAIADGIEKMSNINFALLRYTKSNMYQALLDIRDNTEQFVKLLVSGLRLGGLGDSGSSTKSFLGFSSKKVEQLDKGIQLSGSLKDLAAGGGLRQQYENIKTTSKKFWGLISSSKFKTNISQIDDIASSAINDIFKSFKDVVLSATESLGTTTAKVTDILDQFNVDIKVSSQGKTGEEFAADVLAEIGVQLDLAAQRAFPNLEGMKTAYQKIGESTTDFIIRLVSTADDVEYGLKSIGKSLDTSRITSMAEFSQQLVDAMGGVDKFVSQTEFFSDTFLTEVERLAPIQEAVVAELNRLGLGFVNTREEFVAVVKTLDLTTQWGKETYASLMNLAEGFSKVYDVTTSAKTLEEKLADLRKQYVDILKLEKKTVQATALDRQLELEAMEDYMRVGQKYIWAMEDQADLTDRMTTAYEKEKAAIEDTINTLNNQIDTLNKFKETLKSGNTSTLTPEEKYKTTRAEYDRIMSIASSVAVSDAEKVAKNQAIADIPNAANSFLEASKTLYSSSVQYSADFNGILGSLDSLTADLGAQKSVAEMQLTALEGIYSSLGIIAERADTVANLLPQLLTAQQITAYAAQQYYQTYPNGPTAPTPAVVTVNNDVVVQTLNLNNAALIKEVQSLNAQMAAMRAEAERQAAAQVAAAKATAAQAAATAQAVQAQTEWEAAVRFWNENRP